MTEQTYSTSWGTEGPRSGMQSLWRLATWGVLAAVALFFAVISAYSNVGAQRSAVGAAPQTPAPQASTVETTLQRTTAAELRMQLSDNMEETRRLADAVHALAGDRDQLNTRLAAIEHNLEGVTGSIKRDRSAAPQPPTPQPLAQQAPPPSSPTSATAPAAPARAEAARPDAQVASVAPAALPPIPAASVPPAAPEAAPNSPPVIRGEVTKSPVISPAVASISEPEHSDASPDQPPAPGLGVDVGGAANFESLRALWHTTKNNDPSLLDEFYPLVATRENGRTHAPELRLIIGPMPDAEAAAQLCVTLASAHQYCQPVAFEGQRLTVAETSRAPVHHRAVAASGSTTNPVSGFRVVPAYPAGK